MRSAVCRGLLQLCQHFEHQEHPRDEVSGDAKMGVKHLKAEKAGRKNTVNVSTLWLC